MTRTNKWTPVKKRYCITDNDTESINLAILKHVTMVINWRIDKSNRLRRMHECREIEHSLFRIEFRNVFAGLNN